MRGVYWTLSLVLMVTAFAAANAAGATMQEPSTGTREQAAVATGERTVVGCVAQGASGWVLTTDDGRTLSLRGAASDLSPYMGKKVQIHTSWTTRGVHVASPLETGETPAAAPAGGAKAAQEFAGDVHLQFKGKVLGDCLGEKKK